MTLLWRCAKSQCRRHIGASLRIAVRNKVSLRHRCRRGNGPYRIPGVAAYAFDVVRRAVRDEEFTMFAQFAVDPAALPTFSRTSNWRRSSCGPGRPAHRCVVGRTWNATASSSATVKFGGTIWPCDFDLKIVGTFEGSFDDRSVFFNQKYLDGRWAERRGQRWWLRANWWKRLRWCRTDQQSLRQHRRRCAPRQAGV